MNKSTHAPDSPRVATGIRGLDAILQGGYPEHEVLLVEGGSGTGKTTLGLQFLLEGAEAGEDVLYVTLSQTQRGLRKIAESHGWSLEKVNIHDISLVEVTEGAAANQTIFPTAEVELAETMEAILEAIRRINPTRLVLDSVAVLRYLANAPLRYRRQILHLQQVLTLQRAPRDRQCTTLLLGEEPHAPSQRELGILVTGIVRLEQETPEYGNVRRRLSVTKMRGMKFHGGYHNYTIRTGGLEVFPRLTIHSKEDGGEGGVRNAVQSGVAELDRMLGGGLEEGTSCLLIGPTGTGKTSLATLYAYAAAQRGERAAVFTFDEQLGTFHQRSAGLGMDIQPLVEKGLIRLQSIDVAELSPGEFAQAVRHAVEVEECKVVLIDSLTGYMSAMPQQEQLLTQMHEMLTYMRHRGVLSILMVAQHGLVGNKTAGPIDISYLADSVLLLRRFEAHGGLRKALSVVKKRHGPHEKSIREIRMSSKGIRLGEPLTEFTGILTGTPTFHGSRRDLMEAENGEG